MFERIVIKEIYDNDNEQDARDITEHKKPEQKLAAAKVAPTSQVFWISAHLRIHGRAPRSNHCPLRSARNHADQQQTDWVQAMLQRAFAR
jgi:hypothetical protein